MFGIFDFTIWDFLDQKGNPYIDYTKDNKKREKGKKRKWIYTTLSDGTKLLKSKE